VAINRSYNMLRSRQREEQRLARVPIMLVDDADDPSLYAERSEQRARVRAVLAGLPERQAQLLVLRHAGLSYAEVADAIGVAPGSIGTLLARAEHAFSEAYQQLEQETRQPVQTA
ncbi:MAG TPA: sigma-70 family RNA polymerase sigma factor, partial [Roseiflexaceae bacterium]|nr:sigma-70 family RNA polymerase sigma factor [Roseiflexaceae bacterium]